MNSRFTICLQVADCAVIYAKHSYYKVCMLKTFLYRLNDYKYECTMDQELYTEVLAGTSASELAR